MKIEYSEESFRDIRRTFYPKGSGPLRLMRIIVEILDVVSNENGWDIGQKQNPLK